MTISNTITIDALWNVINLCEYVFQKSYNYFEICTSEICRNIKVVKKCILPINEGVLNKGVLNNDFAKIVDAIKKGKVLKIKCSKCDKERSVSVRCTIY